MFKYIMFKKQNLSSTVNWQEYANYFCLSFERHFLPNYEINLINF